MSSSHEDDWLRESEEFHCALIEIAAQRDDARKELAALRADRDALQAKLRTQEVISVELVARCEETQAKLEAAERERDALRDALMLARGDCERSEGYRETLNGWLQTERTRAERAESQRDTATALLRDIASECKIGPTYLAEIAKLTASAAPEGECAKCKACDGTGSLYAVDAGPCRECNGTGRDQDAQRARGGDDA